MSEKEQEFTLEDIIAEFGGTPRREQPQETQAPDQEPEKMEEAALPAEPVTAEEKGACPQSAVAEDETIRMDPVVTEDETIRIDPVVTEDATIRMDPVVSEDATIRMDPVVTEDETIRMDPVVTEDATIRMEPVGEAEEVPSAAPQPAQEEKEAFSGDWEPEYEQPIAEYVPPRPILIHPRAKIRELKRQLVAGPEKEYYALLERGVGKLQMAMFFSILVVLISAVATGIYALDLVSPNRMKLMIFGQLLAMLVCALLGYNQLLEGLADLKNKQFSLNTLLCFTFLLCVADGVLCLQDLRVPCCAAFGLQMTMSLWNAYQRRNTRLGQLDTMRRATQLVGIGLQEQSYEDQAGLLRGEGRVEDFMESYAKPSRLSKVLSVYALVVLFVSIGMGVGAGVFHGMSGGVMTGISIGVQTAAVTLLVAVPASMFVTVSRPLAVLEHRLHSLGAVICGWRGVEGLCKKAVFPVSHTDLFPGNTAKLNGVKFYGDRQSDQVVAYAAALVCADGGALKPSFEHLLDSRNGIHYRVENFNPYGNGGIGGEVNQEPVLVGTMEFLKSMGVEIPEGIKLKHAVGVSIDGQMCGLFALTYDRHRSAAAGLQSLCGYRGLRPVITTGDFMLTDTFLASKFSVKAKRILFPEYDRRKQLQEKQLPEEQPILAICTTDSLAPAAFCVTGARTAKRASNAGVAVHMIGGILGIVMMAVLSFLGARELLTPANMLLYQIIWTVPGILITEWTRAI